MESEEREPLMMESEGREPLMIVESDSEELSTQTLPTTAQVPSHKRHLLIKITLVLGNLISSIGLYATTPIYATVMTDVSDIYNLLIITGFFFPVLLAITWIGEFRIQNHFLKLSVL